MRECVFGCGAASNKLANGQEGKEKLFRRRLTESASNREPLSNLANALNNGSSKLHPVYLMFLESALHYTCYQ
jgi:hypothetical protein